MSARIAAIGVSLFAVLPAAAGELKYDEAKQLIAGKLFSYSCFDGTTGAGRIHPDGSVAGTVRVQGAGPLRFITFPAGTVHNRGGSICASVKGIPLSPCFRVVQTSPRSFRGSIFGLNFAYCDFVGRGARLELARGGHANPDVATAGNRD